MCECMLCIYVCKEYKDIVKCHTLASKENSMSEEEIPRFII